MCFVIGILYILLSIIPTCPGNDINKLEEYNDDPFSDLQARMDVNHTQNT